MGAIIGALIGRHLAHEEEKRQTAREMVLPAIASRIHNPQDRSFSDDQVMQAIDTADALKMIDKHAVFALRYQMKAAKKAADEQAVKEAEQQRQGQNLAQLQQAQNQNQNLGVPNMNPQAPAPALPAPPEALGKDGGFSPVGAQQPPPDAGSILQRLIPMLAQQQQAQQGGPPPGGPPPGPGAPPSPFGNGAGAGPAPATPNPVTAMKVGSAAGGTGFGGPPAVTPPAPGAPLTPPAPPAPKPRFFLLGNDPDVAAAAKGRYEAAAALPGAEQKNRLDLDLARNKMQQEYEVKKAIFSKEPWFNQLSERERAIVLSGQNISPGMHFNQAGMAMSDESDVDRNGNPVPVGTIGKRMNVNGQWFFEPAATGLSFQTTTNPDGSTSITPVNRYTGNVAQPPGGSPNFHGPVNVRDLHGVNPAMMPHFTDTATNRETIGTIGGNSVVIPVTNRSRVTRGVIGAGPQAAPGAANPGATAPTRRLPAPSSAATGTTPNVAPDGTVLPAGVRYLGPTAAEHKMDVENPLTTKGQDASALLAPKLEKVRTIKKVLEQYKNDSTPATTLIPMLAYKLGFGTDQTKFLADLNLSSLNQVAAVTGGMSRSQKVFDEGKLHVPATWTDSKKSMYQKISGILEFMESQEKAIKQFQTKNPGRYKPNGLPAQPGAATVAPEPPKGTAEHFIWSIKKGLQPQQQQ